VLGEVEAALSLWDRLKKWWDSKRNPPQESVATRFVRLFESHGVHRNQIPRFIGHGLTLRDVKDDAALLEKLDEALLEAACAKFAVRREWLDGAEEQIHPCHDFYREPEGFAKFLEMLVSRNPDAQWYGVLLVPEEQIGEAWALIILQEPIGMIGDKTIYRYHLLNNWLFSYWRSRAYLTACIAIAWKRKLYIHGRKMPAKEIEALAEGHKLLGWDGGEFWEVRYMKWYPEDMALEPDAFLDGVDRERDDYGITSALQLWLDLDARGLMDTGLNLEPARQKFARELAKYSIAADARDVPLSKG